MQSVETYLYKSLSESCSEIHQARLSAVLDVATGLRNSQNLSLSGLGRNLPGAYACLVIRGDHSVRDACCARSSGRTVLGKMATLEA